MQAGDAAHTEPGADAGPGASTGAVMACVVAGVLVPGAASLASQSERFPSLWSWGPLAPAKIPTALALAALAALALALSRRACAHWLSPHERVRRWARRAGFVLLLAAVGALLLRWTVGFSSLDSKTWVSLADQPIVLGSGALGRGSHYLTFHLARALGLGSWIHPELIPKSRALVLASAGAGLFALGALLLLGRRAFPASSRWSSVPFLFVTPVAIFYAGFQEVTPWYYAFTTSYLLVGLRYLHLESSRPPWPESLVLMLAIWSHGSACFVTGAHAFLCLHWLHRTPASSGARWSPARVAQLALLCLIPFAAMLGTMAWAWAFGSGSAKLQWYGHALGGKDGILFVAPTTGARRAASHVVFASREYWEAQLNLLLFACPLLLVVPAAVVKTLETRRPQTLFLGAGLIGLLLLAFTFNPHARGGYRSDFDIVAGFALPTTFLVALWWDAHWSDRQREALSLASAAAVFGFLLVLRLRFP